VHPVWRRSKGCEANSVLAADWRSRRSSEIGDAMSLTREEVEKVALLARLRLTDDELELMTSQLGQVLGYIQQLDQLDTAEVEPLAHPLDLFNVLAADELQPSLPRDKALASAPKADDECFLVPAVLGD